MQVISLLLLLNLCFTSLNHEKNNSYQLIISCLISCRCTGYGEGIRICQCTGLSDHNTGGIHTHVNNRTQGWLF